MYTQCANHECEAAFKVTAETLKSAMGMVRCTKCATVFNALSTIMDQPPEGEVTVVDSQLPFSELGDKIVMDASVSARLINTLGRARSAEELANDRTPVADAETSDEQTNEPDLGPETAPLSAISADEEEDLPQVDDAVRERAVEKRSAMDELEESIPGIESLPKQTSDERPAKQKLFEIFVAYCPTATDLQHALRNLLRQKKRASMGLAAICFGVTALLLAGGFIEWNNWALRESTIQSRLGHIQIVRPNYFELGESDPFAFLLPGDTEMLDKIEQRPEVEVISPRLAFTGLISFGETSIPFKGEGVIPEKEGKVSKWLWVIDGEDLAGGEPGVILGKGLAKNLGAEPGDTVVLVSSPAGGGMGAVEVKVAGIFQTASKPYDDASLRVTLGTARELVRVEGAHNWVVLLQETSMTDSVLDQLRGEYASANEYEFVPWLDLAEFYKKVVVLFTAQVNLVRMIIALIIVVSISNTLIMAVNERTSEIGTLMALGLKRNRIVAIFMGEGLILGVIGGVIGALLGWVLAIVISKIGIPMPPSPGMDFSFEGEIMVTWSLAIGGVFLGVIATLAASFYPARKASRLEIVDALRHSK